MTPSSTFPRQLARTNLFTHGEPTRFTIVRGGCSVLFLRSRAGDDPMTCLWALDIESGEERLLAEAVDTYAADNTGDVVTFTHDGGLWVVDVPTGRTRNLPVIGPVLDPVPDPAGRRIAYRRGNALHVVEMTGSDDAVAFDDHDDMVYGTTEHAGARGHWWSPDGLRLLVARTDYSPVERWHLHDGVDPAAPPRVVRYAAVGKANVDTTLWLVSLGGSRQEVHWDRRSFEYLVGAGWDTHGPYAVVQSRNQRTVRFLAIDTTTGETTTVHEQRDDHWVQLVPGAPTRTSSGALVGHVDEHGTRRLTVDGEPVTPSGVQLREVLSVDGGDILFSASTTPRETQLWQHTLGGDTVQVTTETGVHSGVRRDGTTVVVRQHVAIVRSANAPTEIASFAERPVLDVHATPLVLGPRALHANLYLPSWYQAGDAPLPVLVDPYGGAAMQRVTAEVNWRALISQWFAEQGFAVLVADGRGTPGRGPDWERAVHGDMFGPPLDDQVTALHEAARVSPALDLTRVGIRGWSFSGSLAVLAVLRRPDVFHVAVAGAGVTDQTLYNTHWRERFLGHPDEFPARYEASSLLREAPNLTRPLLLMHGLADDNVHPANTMRLSRALFAAGRPHELLLLPGVGHRPFTSAAAENLLPRQAQFLQQHLRAPTRHDMASQSSQQPQDAQHDESTVTVADLQRVAELGRDLLDDDVMRDAWS